MHMSPFDDEERMTYGWESAEKAANFVRLRTLAARSTGELSAPSGRGEFAEEEFSSIARLSYAPSRL